MSHRPVLVPQPCQNTYEAILHTFQADKPLTPGQLNFLLWHAKQLSGAHFDPIIRAYKIGERCVHSFLVADELKNVESTHRFKEKLESLLQDQQHGIMAKFTIAQFQNLTAIEHIIHFVYFDGNRIVVESPLIRGKKAHAYFFQWGNIIGIVRYEIVREALISETDAIVYFELRNKRELTEFMHAFYLKYNADFELINEKQVILQELLHKLNLEKENLNKALVEKELLEKKDYLNKLPHEEPHFNPKLVEQEIAQNEKKYLDEIEQAEVLDAEKSDYELIEQQRLEQEQLKEEKLEKNNREIQEKEEERVKQQRSLQAKHIEEHIPDLHKDFNNRLSSIFPPRYQLNRPMPNK